MLNVGRGTATTCQTRSRRAFLQVGTLGALGWSLGDLFAARSLANPAGPDAPARAVIVLWLWGGPSHLDTFDLKPDAPLEYRGPFEPIVSRTPGLRVCELLPGLARRSDRYAVIRTMAHESNDHGVAGTIALTGNIAGAVGLDGQAKPNAMRPSTGAIVGRFAKDQGKSNGKGLPPYVILGDPLHQGLRRVVGEGGGTLGAANDPFRINYEPGVGLKLPDIALPENVAAGRFDARWDLRSRLASEDLSSAQFAAMERHYALAQSLIGSSKSLTALDIDREPARLRESYGRHRFGQCCLIARRLVESGLPFVQVNWSTHVEGPEDRGDGGWDMHDRYFQIMQDRHAGILDQGLSALLDDLDSRGLLSTTMVVAAGEFGRTPRINEKAGRDHWNHCYSALVAGAGVQGGRTVGTSDKRAERPADRPVSPADLNATILARLGIGATELTGMGLTPIGTPVEELFA